MATAIWNETYCQQINRLTTEMLHSADPIFELQPNYVALQTWEDQYSFRSLTYEENMNGYTSRELSKELQSHFEREKLWRGPGMAIVLNADNLQGRHNPKWWGTTIHEFGHCLAFQVPNGDGHGPAFIRATCHLWSKCVNWLDRNVEQKVQSHHLMTMYSYNRSPIGLYVNALMSELARFDKPILWHLRQDPPRAFKELCNYDAAKKGEAIPYPA